MGFNNVQTFVPTPPPTPPPTPAKLYVSTFNGGTTSAYFNGDIYATNYFAASDSNLKENIQPLTDVNLIMDQLEAKTYNFKLQGFPSLNLPHGTQSGFLAQDVQAVAPNLVSDKQPASDRTPYLF